MSRPSYLDFAGLGNLPGDRRDDARPSNRHPPSPNGTQRLIVPGGPQLEYQAGYRFGAIDSASFAAADYRPEWLVRNMLARGQPAVIGGPAKGMKTSIVIDLALALGTGRDFLGTFAVPKHCRVLLASGESGRFTIQETARRVCQARGIDLASATNCFWDFALPQLSNDSDLAELQRGLRENRIDVGVFDPLYLALLGGSNLQASSMYDMGPLFLKVARTCLNVGCTPILVHHFKQTRRTFEAPDLGDLAFAGIQEFARQWLLVNRREQFAPGTGQHKIWLSAGGSMGHAGLWAVDIDEGQLGEDFSGRTWEVIVRTQTEAIQARKDDEQAVKRQRDLEKESDQETRLLMALDELAGPDKAAGLTKVRDAAGLNSGAMSLTVLRLKNRGIIEELPTEVAFGTGKRTVPGLRRVRDLD